ncbi:MAG: c-type cytochrome [Pirellulaceae bacterium]
MSRTGLNRLLIVVIAILVLLAWVLRRDVSQPNYVFTPEMVFSVPYDSFSANPVFADGKTMQLPVPGTVARGATFFDYEATEADALRAGEELTNPWADDSIETDLVLAAKSRGHQIFSTYCLPCHGAVGNGDGPVASRGFPPPPALSAESGLKMSDGQMFHVLTFGQKNMPGYASQISEDDRWKAILHVRSLQDAAVRKAEAEQLARDSIEAGRQLFEKLNCNKCHTVSPDMKPVGPFLGNVALAYTREQLRIAIQHPSKTIAEGYLAQVFLMIDGRTHSGFVTSETDEQITIRNTDGNEIVLPVDDIDDRRTLEKSPMPEGLIKDLADDEMQLLLDYLKSMATDAAPSETPAGESPEEPANAEDSSNQNK